MAKISRIMTGGAPCSMKEGILIARAEAVKMKEARMSSEGCILTVVSLILTEEEAKQ